MNTRRFFSTALAALVAATGIASPAFGADDAAKGQEILDAVVAHLVDAGGFDFEAALNFTAELDGQTIGSDSRYGITFSAPDKASVRLVNDEVDIATFADADGVTIYRSRFDQYVVGRRPSTLVQVVENSGWGPVDITVSILSELVTSEPFAGAVVSYVGEESFEGNKTHRLSLSNRGHKWDMWVDAGDTPAIRRIVPDMTPFIEEIEAQNSKITIEVEAKFESWKFGADHGAALEFRPPDDAERVAAFRPPHALEGKPAPEFTIAIYGGGELDISKKKDDEIYILDFWATWCGPCRQAMPIIDRVSKEFADKGVKLFAVNLRETDEQIKDYLDSSNLSDLTVAMDVTGAVAEDYEAMSIPQTVIIGKGGIVEIVHVGFSAALETELREELTKMTGAEK